MEETKNNLMYRRYRNSLIYKPVTLLLPVGNVLPRPVVSVLLGQAEVDKKELVAVAANPHQEVIRLDVPAYRTFIYLLG